ncbi:MAG: P-loop NTPase [Rubricoccaceae bacterium]
MTSSSPPGLILAVVSGKGGVGKSTLAVNLAETLSDAGRRVALMDVDLCQSSCATLLNEEPSASALAAASGAVALDRISHTTASGLTLILGGSSARPDGIPETLYDVLDHALDHAARQHDVILIDAPAGIDAPVRWALDRADAALLVLVGEPTSVTGAYTLAKTVWHAVPEYPFLSVVNAADTGSDAAQTTERFAELTTQFLGRAPMPLGWIPYDAHVRAAARSQSPVIRKSAPLRSAFAGLAAELAPLLPALNAAA